MTPFRACLLSFTALMCVATSALAVAQDQSKEADAARGQALAVFKVLKAKDWKGLYSLIAFPADIKGAENADAFAAGFEGGAKDDPDKQAFDQVMAGLSDVKVGMVIIEGDTAYVSTSCTVKIDSDSTRLLGLAKLKKDDGVWKLDLTSSASSEDQISERFAQLIGEPETDGQ